MSEEEEWGVMNRHRPTELHRGPMIERMARDFVLDAESDEMYRGMFYVVRRPVGIWERADD